MAEFSSSLEGSGVFLEEKHVSFIKKVASDKDSFEYIVTEHLRMSGVYWALTPLCLMGKSLKDHLDVEEIVSWVIQCQDSASGG